MNVRYTRRAVAHLLEVQSFIEHDRPGSAKLIGESIKGAVSRLAEFPEMGREGRVVGTRELVIPRLPFIVAYRIAGKHVDVLAILHTARRWPFGFTG